MSALPMGGARLYLCEDCGEWFVHPNGVAMHARDIAAMQFDPASAKKPGTSHTSFVVYERVNE